MKHVPLALLLIFVGLTALAQPQLRVGGELGSRFVGNQMGASHVTPITEETWYEWPYHGPRVGLNGRLFFGKYGHFQFGVQGHYFTKYVDASLMSLGSASQNRTDIAIRISMAEVSLPVSIGFVIREKRLAHILHVGMSPGFFLGARERRDYRLTSSTLPQTVSSYGTSDVDSVRLSNRINMHATLGYQVELPFPVYLGAQYSLGFKSHIWGMSSVIYLPKSQITLFIGYRPFRLSRVKGVPKTLFN